MEARRLSYYSAVKQMSNCSIVKCRGFLYDFIVILNVYLEFSKYGDTYAKLRFIILLKLFVEKIVKRAPI